LVVGYDGSENSARALEYALGRADAAGGAVVAVHAFEAPADWLGAPYYQQALDEHRELAMEVMRAIETRPGVETDLAIGPPVEALTRVAHARDAAEIVVGARGLGRFRAALGSVSHELLHEADRPVAVVPSASS
jgi:nucleotide-binding universal stress UspA family protein